MSTPLFHVFSSAQVSITVAGVPINPGGYVADFLQVDYNTDAFTYVAGAAGGGTRIQTSDRSATVTLTLLGGAASNALLTAAHVTDLSSGLGVGPLKVIDNLAEGTVFEAAHCWIKKMPSVSWGKENAGEYAWVLETNYLVMNLGTNQIL